MTSTLESETGIADPVSQPPHNEAAEQSVLGGLMLNAAAIPGVAAALTVTDFYRPAHQALYRCLLDMHESGTPVDEIAVFDELQRRGDLIRIGGGPYLHTVIASVTTNANLDYHVEIVAEKALLRRVGETGTRLVQMSEAGVADPGQVGELVARVRAELDQVADQRASPQAERVRDGAAFILAEDDTVAAVWGHGDLVLWPEGEGLMLAGNQGIGKTTVGQQLVLHLIGVRRGPFLGLPVRPIAGRVLYLAMDRPRQAARSFRRMVGPGDSPALRDRLTVWSGPLPVNILTSPQVLANWISRTCPDVSVLVVDSVKDLAPGISKDEVGAAVNLAFQEVIARGTELLLLHHGRKAGAGSQRGTSLDDLYGSTWLTSGLGSVLLLDGQPGDALVTALHVKQPAEQIPEFVIRHDQRAGISVRHGDDIPTLVEQVAQAGTTGLTARDVAVVQYGSDGEAAVKKAKRALSKLVADRAVRVEPGSNSASGGGANRYVADAA